MQHGDGGKGSERRPGAGYQDGWDRIFGKPKMSAGKTTKNQNQFQNFQIGKPVDFDPPETQGGICKDSEG